MEITYSKVGDYYLPNLILPEEEAAIGKYGRMRRRYLKEYRPVLYSNLILSGKLYQHLSEIDRTCNERLNLIIQQIKSRDGVTEKLKAENHLEWVRRMNSIQNRAEEIILSELIYR